MVSIQRILPFKLTLCMALRSNGWLSLMDGDLSGLQDLDARGREIMLAFASATIDEVLRSFLNSSEEYVYRQYIVGKAGQPASDYALIDHIKQLQTPLSHQQIAFVRHYYVEYMHTVGNGWLCMQQRQEEGEQIVSALGLLKKMTA